MGEARDGRPTSDGQARRTKGQKRIESILAAVPKAREQLLAAIDDLGPVLTVDAIQSAAQNPDPRERNKVAVIERELDVLVAYLEELATRALAEGQRLGTVPKEKGQPWRRLAELEVIPASAAQRLQDTKEMRNELAHAYPPTSWRALHDAVEILLAELDRYKVKVSEWMVEVGVLPE